MCVSRNLANVRLRQRLDVLWLVYHLVRHCKSCIQRMDEELIRLKLEAYRNEIDLLQRHVERYKEQNRQLIRFIFKLRKNGTTRKRWNKGM